MLMSNIDDIRTRIMELENAACFDQDAWAKVLMQLSDSPCRRADAVRRMATAQANQPALVLRKNGKTNMVINAIAAGSVSVATLAEGRVANMEGVD